MLGEAETGLWMRARGERGMRKSWRLVFALGALLLLVGCGGQKPQASGGSTGSQTGAGSGAISVEATEFAFSPSKISTTAGTKTIELKNKGTIEHDLKIEALKVETGNVAPGATKSVSADLKPGTYEFYCSIPGHKEAGMVGTLQVS